MSSVCCFFPGFQRFFSSSFSPPLFRFSFVGVCGNTLSGNKLGAIYSSPALVSRRKMLQINLKPFGKIKLYETTLLRQVEEKVK